VVGDSGDAPAGLVGVEATGVWPQAATNNTATNNPANLTEAITPSAIDAFRGLCPVVFLVAKYDLGQTHNTPPYAQLSARVSTTLPTNRASQRDRRIAQRRVPAGSRYGNCGLR
jgi:hypothetical protein